jgi:hypothetical protein
MRERRRFNLTKAKRKKPGNPGFLELRTIVLEQVWLRTDDTIGKCVGNRSNLH